MKAKISLLAAVVLLCAAAAGAQQAPQSLTIVADYTIHAGQEAAWDELVRTVGAPVRDQLMKEGVVLGWGVDVPVQRMPGTSTHSIWVSVNGWDGVEKYQAALAAAVAKVPAERIARIIDNSKTRDWIFRDLVTGHGSAPPPAGMLPFTRVNLRTARPGKGVEYRQLWERYNKPVFDKLVADGAIAAYGFGVEAAPTTGDFTHFVWMSAASLAALDRVGAAFAADRQARSAEERQRMNAAFEECLDSSANRSFFLRAVTFKVAMPQ